MKIKWTQDKLAELAEGFATWREFLDKYPGAQAAQRKGTIDPWAIWRKGGIKSYSDDPRAIMDATDEDQLIRENWRPLAESFGVPGEQSSSESIERVIDTMHQGAIERYEWKKAHAQRQHDQLKALTDQELVEKMNKFAYLFKDEAMLPTIEEFKLRGLPLFMVNSVFAQVI